VLLDKSGFNRKLAAFLLTTKRPPVEVLKTQAKGVLTTAIAYTPPGHAGSPLSRSRQAGEGAVRSDVGRVFFESRNVVRSDLSPLHSRARSRATGRVQRGITRAPTDAAALEGYANRQAAKVGFFASGWKRAAAALGAKLPAWCRRHNAPGDYGLRSVGARHGISFANLTAFGRQHPQLSRLLELALRVQEGKMRRQTTSYYKRMGKQSGFR